MGTIYNALMYLTSWPLALLLIAGGLYFTLRTGFIQIRLFRESFRVLKEKPENGRISSFGALMVSTASRVGTGNIIGVSTAICLGGPGAVFWMWLTAIIGGASAFVESTLAQIYKRRNADGNCYGGPSFYIESACRSKFLAVIFALALIFTYGVGYNMLASYNLQSSFETFSFYRPEYCWIFGIVTAAFFLFTILGGSRRLIRATAILVPVMGVLYILMALAAIVINYEVFLPTVKLIISDAFNFQAIFAGFSGSVLMYGLKRGLYSNEAGIGSAPNAAASAEVSHPVKQGLVQMLSVFIDTNILCSATALMCLFGSVKPEASIAGAIYVQKSLYGTFGAFGPCFVAGAMVLFAFTTLLGNFYYVENCCNYLAGRPLSRSALTIIRICGTILIALGAGMKMDIAWGIADISQCILAFINIPVCIIIGGAAYRALDDYIRQRKAGKEPVYSAAENGVSADPDCWK